MTFAQQLKKYNPHLYQINKFILDAKKLGYGEIELCIKTHDYVSKRIEMKAVKPKKITLAKSIKKRVVVGNENKCTTCIPAPNKWIAVDNVKNPHCPGCGKGLLRKKFKGFAQRVGVKKEGGKNE